MRLISSPGLNEPVGNWVSQRTTDNGEIGFAGNFTSIAVMDKSNRLVAGFVYHDWHPVHKTISMTLASDGPKWATRRNIEMLLRYPFVELGCQRITVMVNESNHASLRLAEGVGFKREAVLERAAGTQNIIVLRLFIEEWRAGKFNRMIHHEQAKSAIAA